MSVTEDSRVPRRRRLLTIGPRLLVSFLVIILLTALIGLLAVQQLSTLIATTNELSTHDLPEVTTIGSLRTLLYRQRDLEQRLVSADGQNIAGDLAALTTTLDAIAAQRDTLLTFEPPDSSGKQVIDTTAVQQFIVGLGQANATSRRLQALVSSGRISEAQVLEQDRQGALLQTLLDQTAQLRKLEQSEAAAAAAQVEQQSSHATWLILALTLFSVPLSALLALLITRSLTGPLSALLHATEAITSGDLDVQPRITPGDELGRLASAFDTMRLNLRSTIATLALERQQTQAIIDASADGVMLVDAERKILQFNPAAERLTGWTQNEALGRHCWDIFGCLGETGAEEGEHQYDCPLAAALVSNPAASSTEVRAYSRDGQHRWFAVSCAPVARAEDDAESRHFVVGIHDVSELKAVEQLKSDFVAMVSHELRAPLSTVTGSVETLSLLDPVGDHEAYHEVISILSQQTGRLRRVVEEVLQLTRVEAGRLQIHLRPLAIAEFLEEVLESTRLAWVGSDRPLSLRTPEADSLVWADRASLEIVVRNLLDNARKYSPPETPIEVEVEAPPTTNHVRVRVSDHGPGIPPEQLDRIFESFSRGTSSSHNWTRGYGLGLYIARELLRAHNGEIRAENREEGGASFVFTLHAVAEDAGAEASDEAEGIPA